ncbi:TlpA family protein disulfide reductase [Sphingomonas immobilis]|uniref:TlpA disulfide reductase family protein n=1 Tax=Sphingomonas immobilis TaxID=3063997 RepID=A0ABT9A4P0_9SPHN|nr:TlpA disulfide reductase family protein [Sphingomonas sp. CA1-15]MDO7844503.1 TlpA disulfide reductase family protein [Sphingomonas sp. CA1-15]
MGKYKVAFAALFAMLVVAAPPALARQKIVVGQPAPDFKMRLADGTRVTLADLRGQVVILNLWATWCGPCKEEMPTLDQMQVNGAKLGLRIFGVLTLDTADISRMGRLTKVLHYPLVKYISDDYGPIGNAVPTNYIIDRNGIVRYAKATAMNIKTFAELVGPILEEPVKPAAVTTGGTK